MKISVSNHENLHFSSKVRLKADSSGLVDLTKSEPSCGAYQVSDLMALYWKMDYQKGSDKRLLKFHEVSFNTQYLTNLTQRRRIVQKDQGARSNIAGIIGLTDTSNLM